MKPKLKPLIIPLTLLLALSCGEERREFRYRKAPNWTPDGKIVFIEEYGIDITKHTPTGELGSGEDYTLTLYEMNRDGSNLTKIGVIYYVDGACPGGPVSTSASDTLIVACYEGYEGYKMVLVNRNTREIVKDLGQGAYADFSPDGKRIVYQKYSGDTPQGIWIMDIETGEERCLVSDTNATYPDWSPSGKYVVYDLCPAWDTAKMFIVDTLGNLVYDSLPYLDTPDWSKWSDSLILGSGIYEIIVLHLPSMTAETLNPRGMLTRWSPDGEWLTLFTVHDDVRGYFAVNKEGTVWTPLQP